MDTLLDSSFRHDRTLTCPLVFRFPTRLSPVTDDARSSVHRTITSSEATDLVLKSCAHARNFVSHVSQGDAVSDPALPVSRISQTSSQAFLWFPVGPDSASGSSNLLPPVKVGSTIDTGSGVSFVPDDVLATRTTNRITTIMSFFVARRLGHVALLGRGSAG